jgi:hormone-sensitive lipase
LWIINYAPIYFNIHPSKIILAGDSAGGNLVAAIAIQCIKENIRVPDALMLCYPALNLDIKFFTPSFLVSLEDTSKISK